MERRGGLGKCKQKLYQGDCHKCVDKYLRQARVKPAKCDLVLVGCVT